MKYFDEVAGNYQARSQSGIWNKIRAIEKEAVLTELDVRPGEKILDVGCGPGFYAIELAKLGAQVTGIDSSASMIEQFRRLNFRSHCGSFESFPFESRFDKVLIAGAGEFISAFKAFLLQIHNVLNHPGRAVILAPRNNMIGMSYKLWHRSHGCKVLLHDYRKINELHSGLTVTGIRNVTPMSQVITISSNAIGY